MVKHGRIDLHEAADVRPRLRQICGRENGGGSCASASAPTSAAAAYRAGGTIGAGVVEHRKPIRTAAAKEALIREALPKHISPTYSSWLFPAHNIEHPERGEEAAPELMLVPQSVPS